MQEIKPKLSTKPLSETATYLIRIPYVKSLVVILVISFTLLYDKIINVFETITIPMKG
jgi:hypothetical protein